MGTNSSGIQGCFHQQVPSHPTPLMQGSSTAFIPIPQPSHPREGGHLWALPQYY